MYVCIWRCEHAIFCVKILINSHAWNFTLIHAYNYQYKWWPAILYLLISSLARTSCSTGFWLNLNNNPCKKIKFSDSSSFCETCLGLCVCGRNSVGYTDLVSCTCVFSIIHSSFSSSQYLMHKFRFIQNWCCFWPHTSKAEVYDTAPKAVNRRKYLVGLHKTITKPVSKLINIVPNWVPLLLFIFLFYSNNILISDRKFH